MSVSTNIQIFDFFLNEHRYELCKIRIKKIIIKIFHLQLQEQGICYSNNTIAWQKLGERHISSKWHLRVKGNVTGDIFRNNKKLSLIESTLTGNAKLFFSALGLWGGRQFEGGRGRAQMTTTAHKTAAFTIVHVYQYTSYWIHNYIIRYNCICYGLVWQPNEAVIKELAVPFIRA